MASHSLNCGSRKETSYFSFLHSHPRSEFAIGSQLQVIRKEIINGEIRAASMIESGLYTNNAICIENNIKITLILYNV